MRASEVAAFERRPRARDRLRARRRRRGARLAAAAALECLGEYRDVLRQRLAAQRVLGEARAFVAAAEPEQRARAVV